jgi:hypothetical protein
MGQRRWAGKAQEINTRQLSHRQCLAQGEPARAACQNSAGSNGAHRAVRTPARASPRRTHSLLVSAML